METKTRLKLQRNIILLLIAASSILIRLLIEYDFDHSALLYVGVPFLIAMALCWVDRPDAQGNEIRELWNNLLRAMIIMLGSSVVLFEGFLCVVMFMPIYLTVILLTFIYLYWVKKSRAGRTYVHVLPLLLLFSAMEGTLPELTAERHDQVKVSREIAASVDEIWTQLAKPPQLQVERSWFLSLFPMPYQIDYQGLEAGDVHQIHFRYHRWFFTNTHTGSMKLKINSISPKHLDAHFIADDSYISNYMSLEGALITLEAIDQTHTRVSLVIDYQRQLDPVWYFEPLQRFGLSEFGDFLLVEMVTPK